MNQSSLAVDQKECQCKSKEKLKKITAIVRELREMNSELASILHQTKFDLKESEKLNDQLNNEKNKLIHEKVSTLIDQTLDLVCFQANKSAEVLAKVESNTNKAINESRVAFLANFYFVFRIIASTSMAIALGWIFYNILKWGSLFGPLEELPDYLYFLAFEPL